MATGLSLICCITSLTYLGLSFPICKMGAFLQSPARQRGRRDQPVWFESELALVWDDREQGAPRLEVGQREAGSWKGHLLLLEHSSPQAPDTRGGGGGSEAVVGLSNTEEMRRQGRGPGAAHPRRTGLFSALPQGSHREPSVGYPLPPCSRSPWPHVTRTRSPHSCVTPWAWRRLASPRR